MGSTGFYLVFHLKIGQPGVLTYSYRELPSFAKFYWVLLGLTGFDWVRLGFTGFYRVLPGFTGFYLVLLSFT